MLRLSTRQKREVYSISSLLLHLIVFIALLVSLNSCGLLNPEAEVEPDACTTLATVKDMRSLDGCGFILVLDTGEKLEPVVNYASWCGWSGMQQQQAYSGAGALTEGQRVRIGYKEVNRATACMMGTTVEITCLSEITPSPLTAN